MPLIDALPIHRVTWPGLYSGLIHPEPRRDASFLIFMPLERRAIQAFASGSRVLPCSDCCDHRLALMGRSPRGSTVFVVPNLLPAHCSNRRMLIQFLSRIVGA